MRRQKTATELQRSADMWGRIFVGWLAFCILGIIGLAIFGAITNNVGSYSCLH